MNSLLFTSKLLTRDQGKEPNSASRDRLFQVDSRGAFRVMLLMLKLYLLVLFSAGKFFDYARFGFVHRVNQSAGTVSLTIPSSRDFQFVGIIYSRVG